MIHDKNKSENTVIFREKLSKLATLLFSGSRKTSLPSTSTAQEKKLWWSEGMDDFQEKENPSKRKKKTKSEPSQDVPSTSKYPAPGKPKVFF